MNATTKPEVWIVTVHESAVADMRAMKKCDIRMFHDVVYWLGQLALERDPRSPRNVRLDVCHLNRDAPGWFRLRVRGHDWRIVFRLLQSERGYVFEIHPDEFIHPNANAESVQIMAATPRSSAYGAALHALHRLVTGKKHRGRH